jgi:hypothetical protein
MLVVGSTPQLNVVSDGGSSVRKWHDMMNLEKAPLRASTARTDKRASAVVSHPHRASYC